MKDARTLADSVSTDNVAGAAELSMSSSLAVGLGVGLPLTAILIILAVLLARYMYCTYWTGNHYSLFN